MMLQGRPRVNRPPLSQPPFFRAPAGDRPGSRRPAPGAYGPAVVSTSDAGKKKAASILAFSGESEAWIALRSFDSA